MSTPFASPAELATHLRTATQAEADAGSGDTLDTGAALQALAAASGAIRSVCGWSISQETRTDTVPVVSGCIFLPTLYLTAASVAISGSAVDPSSVTVWRNGVLDVARTSGSAATVTYTHGYDPVPDVVKAVCLEWAAGDYVNTSKLASVTYGNVTEVYSRGASGALADPAGDPRLAPFRLPSVG